jgi:hypothetical protein
MINISDKQGWVSMLGQKDAFVLEVVDSLKKRDFIFQRTTNLIAKKIEFVFEAISEYLNQQQSNIEWESVDTNNGMLVVVAKIQTRGAVTDDHKVLTVGIPLDIIQLQSKDKIVEFFRQSEEARLAREAEVEELVDNVVTSAMMRESADVDFYDDEDDTVNSIRRSLPKRVLH